MCEYCREGVGKSILHDDDFEFLNIFIMNGMLWEKSMDMGIEINYCPMCRTKIGRRWTKGGRAMTKEQEAIENLTDLLKQRNEQQVQITTYNLFENIETILSMLKENSAEIEQKNTELAEKTAEIERLNRQINLMAKAMDKIQDPQVCKYCDNKINLNHGYCTDAGKCKKGIKQYFERKVKKDI